MSGTVFCTASDAMLIGIILRAKRRLVYAAPAVSSAVAEVLASRFSKAGDMAITIILDADPEVYRLGYGSPEGLEMLRAAAAEWMIELRTEPGLRIGIVAADNSTMVFAPTPLLVEAGAKGFEQKPNAIVIDGTEANRVAEAVGGDINREIGGAALTPSMAEAVHADLEADPPKPFELARAVRVFSSKAQYVELKVENCRFSTRQLKLPAELLDVTDPDLKVRISAKMKLHDGKLGAVKVKLVDLEGRESERVVGEEWVKSERTRIENTYTFVVPHHGRIILHTDREKFAREVACFETNVRNFRDALIAALQETKAKLVETIVNEYAPRWMERPPSHLARWGTSSPDDLERELMRIATRVVEETIDFDEPTTRVIYKDITAASVADPEFIEPLRKAFERQGAPQSFVNGLFAFFDAAREANPDTRTAAPETAA